MDKYEKAIRSIYKIIPYSNADRKTLEKNISYITSEKRSNKAFQKFYNLDPDNPMAAADLLMERFNQHGGRMLKHHIISPGVPDLDEEQAFLMACDIAAPYAANYQTVFAVHNNIYRRIHIHMVVHLTEIFTGNRAKQSPADFHAERKRMDGIMYDYGAHPLILLPKMQNYQRATFAKTTDIRALSEGSVYEYENEYHDDVTGVDQSVINFFATFAPPEMKPISDEVYCPQVQMPLPASIYDFTKEEGKMLGEALRTDAMKQAIASGFYNDERLEDFLQKVIDTATPNGLARYKLYTKLKKEDSDE